jgi:hypothetical protein
LHNALKADYAADFPLQEWLEEGVDVDEHPNNRHVLLYNAIYFF